MLAYQALRFEHGYWAVISAIIVMQANLGGSIRAGTDRLIGTAIGALLGTLAYRYLGRTPVGVGIALAVTIFVCSWLGLKSSFRLAGVTASIVLLIGQANPWITGFNRFLDVALGVVVAVAVSLVWPSRASQHLRQSLARTFSECDRLLQLSMHCLYADCSREAVEQQKATLRKLGAANLNLLADAGREPGQAFVRRAALLMNLAQRTTDHLFGMDYAAHAMMHDRFHTGLADRLRQTTSQLSFALTQISSAIRERKSDVKLQGLEVALERFEDEFVARRARGESLQFDKDELLRFYSFVFRLRETIAEVRRAAELINQKRDAETESSEHE